MFHVAKLKNSPAVEVWGTGTPRREFLHVDDLADTCLFICCLPKSTYEWYPTNPCQSAPDDNCHPPPVATIDGFPGTIQLFFEYRIQNPQPAANPDRH